MQPGQGAGSEHCGAHRTPEGDCSARSSPRSAGRPRAGLMQSWHPPDMSCPFSAPSSAAWGCHMQPCDGQVLTDVPTETLSVPRNSFSPSRQSSFGTPLSRRQRPGLAPHPRAGHTARPRSPRGLELGRSKQPCAQPSLTDGMWPPRFWAVGEPGELGKTGQGFVFSSVSSRWRKRGRGDTWHKKVPQWHGAAALWLSATVALASGGVQLRALLSRDGDRQVASLLTTAGPGEPKFPVTMVTLSDDPAWC